MEQFFENYFCPIVKTVKISRSSFLFSRQSLLRFLNFMKTSPNVNNSILAEVLPSHSYNSVKNSYNYKNNRQLLEWDITSKYLILYNMVKVYKYHEIPLTEWALILCHKITATKLRALGYGVPVIVVVCKGKQVKNTQYKSDWNKTRYQRNSCTLSNKQHGFCSKGKHFLTGCY